MSAHEETALAELENHALGLLGRLHVLLRRESGRITDIDYMRIDPAYCRHVLAYGMQTANPATREVCGKLARLYFDADGLFRRKPQVPLAQRLRAPAEPSVEELLEIAAPAAPPAVPAPAQPSPAASHHEDIERSYVGRLR